MTSFFTRSQLRRQGLDPDEADVGVIRTPRPACTNLGLIGAVDVEAENVSIVFGCTHQVRHRELRNGRLEADGRWAT